MKLGNFFACGHVNSARTLSNKLLSSCVKQQSTKTASSFGFSNRNVAKLRSQTVAGDRNTLNPPICNQSD